MADVYLAEPAKVSMKRNLGKNKASKAKKNSKKAMLQSIGQNNKVQKIDRKMKKLFRKRARRYNSDEDDDGDDNNPTSVIRDEESSEEEEEQVAVNKDHGASDDDEIGEILPGITKFAEGCKAFRMAFRSIIKKSVPDNSLVS